MMRFICLFTAIEGDFSRYMESLKPFLLAALQNHEEYAVCQIAVGVVGDICRSLNEQAVPYCNDFMVVLMHDLQVCASADC